MATLGYSPNFCGVFSDTQRIIRANFCHFSAISIVFLFPISIAFILYPSLITTLSGPNSVTSYYQQKSHLILTLVYVLFVLLFSLFATASISYSTFHGFYNRPVTFISSIKSIVFSFCPLLLTVIASQIILIVIFIIFGLLGGLAYEGLVVLGIDVDYGSNYSLGFVTFIAILILVVTVYLQVEWSLACVVAVVESKSGFAALKRSSYLIKGMKWIALKIMLYYGVLPGVLAVSCSTLLVCLGGMNGGLAAILEFALCSVLATNLMLSYVASYTVLYVYSMALHGEMALEIAEDSRADYVSLPVDDGKEKDRG